MAPCVELLRAPATEAFKKDGVKVAQGAIDIVSKTPGTLSTYTGVEVQDPNYWFVANVWESLDHHQALRDDKEVYPVLVDALLKGAAGIDFMIHASFTPNDPYDALSAPVTEIGIWTLKENADKQAFTEILEKLIALAHSNPVVTKGGWGPVVEDENKFVILLGWPSVEVFNGPAGKEHPQAAEFLRQLRQYAEPNLKHYVFTKHV